MFEFCNKHYIRIDESNYVIKAFSDAFEQPLETDIRINEEGERHFNLDLFEPGKGPKYKYDAGQIREATEAEQEAWRAAQPLKPKSQLEILQETVDQLVLDSLEV